MTLVNIDPYVILHQKTHVPRAVNFFESQKASEHPVLDVRQNQNFHIVYSQVLLERMYKIDIKSWLFVSTFLTATLCFIRLARPLCEVFTLVCQSIGTPLVQNSLL